MADAQHQDLEDKLNWEAEVAEKQDQYDVEQAELAKARLEQADMAAQRYDEENAWVVPLVAANDTIMAYADDQFAREEHLRKLLEDERAWASYCYQNWARLLEAANLALFIGSEKQERRNFLTSRSTVSSDERAAESRSVQKRL